MDAIKKNVTRLLKARKKSQKDLAADLAITVQTLQYYFSGNITLKNLERIAAALDVDPWQLLRPGELDDDNEPTQTRTTAQQTTGGKLQTICPHCKKPITITIE